MTGEEHALYLPGCTCGADPKGFVAKIATRRGARRAPNSKSNKMIAKKEKRNGLL